MENIVQLMTQKEQEFIEWERYIKEEGYSIDGELLESTTEYKNIKTIINMPTLTKSWLLVAIVSATIAIVSIIKTFLDISQ